MGAHADADGGDLAYLVVASDGTGTDVGLDLFENGQCLVVFATIDREGKVGGAVMTDVLDDHVHIDVGVGDGAEDLIGDAGAVGHAEDG